MWKQGFIMLFLIGVYYVWGYLRLQRRVTELEEKYGK
jgi:hypothetical protein